MTLNHKPDLEEAQARMTAWWHHEVVDRVALAVYAKREAPREEPFTAPRPDTVEERWLNPEWRLAAWEQSFVNTDFLGEAIPYFDTNIGPGSLGLFLGCKGTLVEGTVWYDPVIEDLETAPDLTFDPQGEWYQRHLRLIEIGLAHGESRYYTSIPDLIENLDTLAALHGTEALLLDLVDKPAAVHRFQRQIVDLYFQAYDPMYEMVTQDAYGCCFSAFSTWAPGRYAKLQCDFSAMISPKMFEEFVMPYLDEQTRRLDYTMYHLDGPCAIQHLDLLLSLPRLNAIQWTPGSGDEPIASPKWYPLYERVLKAGKSLVLLGIAGPDVKEIETIVRRFGPKGLYITTYVDSREEGEALLQAARTWT
jgi:hypothetical protein